VAVDRVSESFDGRRNLVVIGASAGGVEVLRRVARDLPADLRAAVCVVLHIAPGSPSMLAHILGRAGQLPCRAAQDGERLRQGLILVAPPDHHLVIEDGHVRLTVGPRENGHRPAIDVLFRSAAEALDGRVVGVILSGTRDDGSAGLAVIKATGGAAIVQDPEEAMYGDMPANAIANVAVDAIVKSDLLASTIVAMVNGQDPPAGTPPEASDPLPHKAEVDPTGGGRNPTRGEPDRVENKPNGYSPDPLIDAQADSVESALWAAVRALDDRTILRRVESDEEDGVGEERAA
jgi:two-component system, chemotaxis family, protein-glutamate methylesterase/glutaminase